MWVCFFKCKDLNIIFFKFFERIIINIEEQFIVPLYLFENKGEKGTFIPYKIVL